MSQLPIQLVLLLLLIAFIPSFSALTNIFDFPSFNASFNGTLIQLHGDASVDMQSRVIDLTNNSVTGNTRNNSGWAIYPTPITLYDSGTGFAADFQSNFSFQINPINGSCRGDGLAFFITNANWSPKAGYNGLGLGIFNRTAGSFDAQMVAIEFDTYLNQGIDPSNHHMGIDVNSYRSSVTTDWALDASMPLNGTAIVEYNSASRTLSSRLAYQNGTLDLPLDNINLTTVLPENVIVGLSASTGSCTEEHRILSWSLSATVPNQTAPKSTASFKKHDVAKIPHM